MAIKFTAAIFEAAALIKAGYAEPEAVRLVAAARRLNEQQAKVLRHRVAAQLVAAARPRLGYRMDGAR